MSVRRIRAAFSSLLLLEEAASTRSREVGLRKLARFLQSTLDREGSAESTGSPHIRRCSGGFNGAMFFYPPGRIYETHNSRACDCSIDRERRSHLEHGRRTGHSRLS